MHTSHRHVRTYADAACAANSLAHPCRCSGYEPYDWGGVFRTWLQRSRQRRTLAELDDRMLRDIGLTRSQAQREAERPFWSADKA
jgi:uncharacterized protein YjiS (DUF1127 family)